MESDKIVGWAIIGYILIAFLNGGYYYNHRADDRYSRGPESVFSGAFWPVYWAGRVAIKVTK